MISSWAASWGRRRDDDPDRDRSQPRDDQGQLGLKSPRLFGDLCTNPGRMPAVLARRCRVGSRSPISAPNPVRAQSATERRNHATTAAREASLRDAIARCLSQE